MALSKRCKGAEDADYDRGVDENAVLSQQHGDPATRHVSNPIHEYELRKLSERKSMNLEPTDSREGLAPSEQEQKPIVRGGGERLQFYKSSWDGHQSCGRGKHSQPRLKSK